MLEVGVNLPSGTYVPFYVGGSLYTVQCCPQPFACKLPLQVGDRRFNMVVESKFAGSLQLLLSSSTDLECKNNLQLDVMSSGSRFGDSLLSRQE